MAYVEGQVTALLAEIDSNDDSITAALAAARLARVLLFPEKAASTPEVAIASVGEVDYTQTVNAGTQLSAALVVVRDSLDAAITAFADILTARADVDPP